MDSPAKTQLRKAKNELSKLRTKELDMGMRGTILPAVQTVIDTSKKRLEETIKALEDVVQAESSGPAPTRRFG